MRKRCGSLVHVTDLAKAHCLALHYLGAGGASDAFNLGSSVGCSVLEIAAAAERVVGKPILRQIGPRRPGDPDRLIADPAKARAELGWHPQFPGIDDIIATALAWYARDIGRAAS